MKHTCSCVARANVFFFNSKRIEQKNMIALCLIQMLTLGVGFGVLLTSLLLTYIVSSKAEVLFSSEREPSSATYWFTQAQDHYYNYYSNYTHEQVASQ